MSRRSTPLLHGSRDGTSQRGRHLPALDPDGVAIDERSLADMLAFVQAFAGQVRFFAAGEDDDEVREAGTWSPFVRRDDISIADIVAHVADPGRFDGERARWLGRPHFALLLAFLELLGKARDQLNGLARRHLDYYYREVLHMLPERAVPDRVAVVLRLAPRVAQLRLPAGTALQAGRDSAGVPRIYRTERELVLNRARVDALRSVHVHRRITGIPDVRKDPDLTAREAFERKLGLALGDPRPGDPVPPWAGAPIDLDFVLGLRPVLNFAGERLFLEHHELRELMQLVRRRAGADAEWSEINRLLGLAAPADPRDFAVNFAQAVGVLDFAIDGLPQVHGVDDLYQYRAEPEVRAYIDQQLAEIGYQKFEALMAIKRRIDSEWAEINRLLERIGRRQRGLLAWSLEPAEPTAFAANLAHALGDSWPPPWPWATGGIDDYETTVRALASHFAVPVERLVRLVAYAERLDDLTEPEWNEIDRILADAHREKLCAARRARLAEIRGDLADLDGFDAVVRFALGRPGDTIAWPEARALLEQHLDRGQLDLLDHFRRQLVEPAAARLFDWPAVYRALELAQRFVQGLPEPVARRVEWRNLYAHDDATALADDPAAPRWKTFGRRPLDPDEAHPPAATLGWAVRTPVLALSQGRRALTLTLGLRGLDPPSFLRGLGIAPEELDEPRLRQALADTLRIEVTTRKAWIEPSLVAARLATGAPGDDYWSALGVPRALDEDRPALQLVLLVDPTVDPLAPREGDRDPWPTLRLTLRQRWDAGACEWTTTLAPFEPLALAAVHLRADVEGLVDLRLQHEDRPLDPRGPVEPFGSRPAAGARLYLGHPELVRARLDALRLDIEWMGLPDSLKSHYLNYPGISGAGDFKARLALVDRGLDLPLTDASLFSEGPAPQAITARARSVSVPDVGAAIHAASPGYRYVRRLDVGAIGDLRAAGRHLQLELTPIDFGHASYPALAAARARELAIGLSRGTVEPAQAAQYGVAPPYTPTVKRLAVAYRTSVELDPGAPGDADDRLLHVHPFGVAPLDAADPRLFPRYDSAGELYIGLRDLDPPQHVSLWLQLAEGTSDPDLEPARVEWSALDGDRWIPLGAQLRHDSTRGLINSGIVELALPAVAPSTLLPGGRYWLRVAVPRSAGGVCDTIDIRAQAVTLCFDDRGNAADHYDQPLAVGSVDRLLEPDARIAAVEQPYTSFGGEPPERPERFYTRVSERLRHKQRALTPWDYERLVLQRFGQIYKARCVSAGASNLEPGRVDVVVIPDIRQQLPGDAFAPRAPANLLADIQAYLAERAPGSARVVVRNAHYVAVAVRLGVRFRPGQDERYAQQRLNDDLSRFLAPWAFDDGAELTIGGRIYASSILDFVDRRDYVDYVAELKLARSEDGENFHIVPVTAEDYHVAAERPDQVLVAARRHHIDIISELDYQQAMFTGINYTKIELDFIVG